MSWAASILVGGVIQILAAGMPALSRIRPAARNWPMLVMQEPMKTSWTGSPAMAESGLTSSGSLGQATSGSVMAARSISRTALYSAWGSRLRRIGSASQARQASMRRRSVSALW